MNLKYGLIAFAGLGISANVSATDLTCSDITFTPEAFAAYEFVDQACLEMVDRNGETFARMTARVVAQTGSGTHVRYTHADGKQGPGHKSNAPKDFEVVLSGQAVKLKDMQVRQEVNIYLSDDYWAPPPVEVAVAAAEVVEEAPPPPPPPPPAPEPEPEPVPVVLPTTAGPLPWLALFGSLFLLLGGALRFVRKQ